MKKLFLPLLAVATAFSAYAADNDVVLNDDGTVTIKVAGTGANLAGSGHGYRNNETHLYPWCDHWDLVEEYSTYGHLRVACGTKGSSVTQPMQCSNGAKNAIPADERFDLKINRGGYTDIALNNIVISLTDANPEYYVSGYTFVGKPCSATASYTVNGTNIETGGTRITKTYPNNFLTNQDVVIALECDNNTAALEFTQFEVTLTKIPDPVEVTYNFPEKNGYTASLKVNLYPSQDAADFIPAAAFFANTGLTETNTTVSATNKTFTVNGTWEFPMDFNTAYRAVIKPSVTEGNSNLRFNGQKVQTTNYTQNPSDFAPQFLWYFTHTGFAANGNPLVTMHTVADAAENGLHFDCNTNNSNAVSNSNASKLELMETGWGSKQASDFMLKVHCEDATAHTANYINHRGEFLSTWQTSTDQPLSNDGCVFRLASLVDADFDNNTDWVTYEGRRVTFKDDQAKSDAKDSHSAEDLRNLFVIPATISKAEAAEMLAVRVQTVKATLALYGIFTEAEMDALFASIAIDQDDLDDYTDLLAEKEAAADAVVCPATIVNQLDGKKYIIKDQSATRQYLYANADANIQHAANFSYNSVWEITKLDNGYFTMKNPAYDKYANALITNATEAGEYAIANLQYYPGYVAIQNMAVEETTANKFLNTNQNGGIRNWAAGDGNTSSFFQFVEVTEAQEQGWIDAIKAHYNFPIGTELGQFSCDDATKANAAAINAMTLANIDYTLFVAPVNATLNPVQTGRLISIKDTNNNYLVMTENGPAFTATPGNAAVFYYTTTGKLMNLAKGNYLATTGSAGHELLNSNTTAEHHAAADPEANAANVEIRATTTDAHANTVGRYAVKYGDNRDLYNLDGTVTGGTNALETDATHSGYFFNVEYVDAVPVEFHGDNYGSLVCPVGMQVPEELDADVAIYVASVSTTRNTDGSEANNITFTAIDEGDEIPAGATVLVYNGGDNAFAFNVKYDVADEAETNEYLAGHHLTKKVAAPQGKSLYAKVPYTGPANAAAMWKVAREGQAPKFTLVRLVPDENGNVETPAASMIVVINNPATGEPAATLQVSPTQDMATGIFELTVDGMDATGAVYDLQGRRLAAPAKGINIVGGRKVLVK